MYRTLKRKHTNPINVRSFSSSKDNDCWFEGIHFRAKARHLNVSLPAKLANKFYVKCQQHKKEVFIKGFKTENGQKRTTKDIRVQKLEQNFQRCNTNTNTNLKGQVDINKKCAKPRSFMLLLYSSSTLIKFLQLYKSLTQNQKGPLNFLCSHCKDIIYFLFNISIKKFLYVKTSPSINSTGEINLHCKQ